MNRRTLLAGLTTGFVGVAGCTSLPNQLSGSDEVTDESISEHKFTLTETENAESNSQRSFEHEAAAQFDREQNRVVVTGQIKGMMDSCVDTSLESLTFDDTEQTLSVTVQNTMTKDQCGAAVGVIPYRLSVTFDGDYPETVAVTHHPNGDTFEKTIHSK